LDAGAGEIEGFAMPAVRSADGEGVERGREFPGGADGDDHIVLRDWGVDANATDALPFRESDGGRCDTAAPGRIDSASSCSRKAKTLALKITTSSHRPARR
jgi:hypothetical protein